MERVAVIRFEFFVPSWSSTSSWTKASPAPRFCDEVVVAGREQGSLLGQEQSRVARAAVFPSNGNSDRLDQPRSQSSRVILLD